jgi:penicillin G amidase
VKSKKTRIIVIIVSIALFLAIASVAAFQIIFRLPQPSYTGNLNIAGLKSPVEVRTDDYGIPHIFAQNEDDLFLAQGYITARERMFEMDLTRLAGRGELSMLLGESMVKTDAYFLTLGFYRAAEAEYPNLTPRAKSTVDAYTRGVNAYISTAQYMPVEYLLLGSKPQPWKPADSLVSGLLMSYRLDSPRAVKPIIYEIYKQAGAETLEYMMPWVPPSAPYISSSSTDQPATALTNMPDLVSLEPNPHAGEQVEFPIIMRQRASNWMIFSGSKTTTGKPVFTGSPDLEAAIPSLFYLTHLKSGDFDVIGGAIPGLPGVHALGFNGHFAWSITVGNGDNVDFFTEKLNPANPNQYLTENGYQDFKVVQETIKVKSKDGFREQKVTVKQSRHGPIISDIMTSMPANCAMMWPGLMGHDGTVEGLLAMNRARNFDEFRQALSVVRGASVHMGYADVDGNIGYQYMTTFPIRKSGNNPLPMPGETGQYDWSGYVPFEDHPFDLNPAKGYLGSFNQMPKPGNYYGTAYFMFERPYRFEDIAKSKDKFTPAEIANMQLDTVDHVAVRWVPEVSRVCGNVAGLSSYAAMLSKWDCSASVNSPEATLFNSFFTHLLNNSLENKLGKKIMDELYGDLHVTIPAQWLIHYMGDNNHVIWDDISTPNVKETRDDQVLKSLKDAVAELTGKYGSDTANWAWGKVHTYTVKHPLGIVLPFLNLSPLPYAGDDFTIDAGWWSRAHPYDAYSGAAIRIVVDMSNLDSMTIMCPPGQSGHYLSPYYSDLAGMWAKGKQIPAHYTDAKSLKQVLTLNPK